MMRLCAQGCGEEGGVPISAVASDRGDTGAIYLRDRIRQAVGHYAMGRVGDKQYKKKKKKNKKVSTSVRGGRWRWVLFCSICSIRDERHTARGVT